MEGLRKSFGGQVVLDGVEAHLHEGEVVLLRGDNGSGKTTLLNILTGNLEPDCGSIHLKTNGREESFRFPRKWWESLNPFDHFTPERVATEGVGRTWQDMRLFPTLTLLDNIALARQRQPAENPLRALMAGSRSMSELANRQASAVLLTELNLAGREQSSGDKISLGQSKRVAIARAVQAGARILFLDEPLSGLDAAGIEEVLGLLSSLARNERLTLVIIEHTFNIPRVLELANTVWTLREGRITVQTPTEARADHSAEAGDGAVALIARHLGSGYQRDDIPLHRGAVLIRFSPANAAADGPVLLELRDLVVRRGSRLVVGQEDSSGKVIGLSFALREGDIAILQAPNGWGKTTLLHSLLGRHRAERGEVLLSGIPLQDSAAWVRTRRGMSAHMSCNTGFPNLTVRETLQLAGTFYEPPLSLAHLQSRRTSTLSGGERQKLALSCIPPAAIGVYDEPFSAVDRSGLDLGLLNIGNNRSTLVLIPAGSSCH